MRALALAVTGLVLSACASVSATSAGGVVDNVWTAKAAMAKADQACGESGRVAKPSNYDALGGSLTFACVTR